MVSVLIKARGDRIARINEALHSAQRNNKEIDRKKFIMEIMSKYGVNRRTATEYYDVAYSRFSGESVL